MAQELLKKTYDIKVSNDKAEQYKHNKKTLIKEFHTTIYNILHSNKTRYS